MTSVWRLIKFKTSEFLQTEGSKLALCSTLMYAQTLKQAFEEGDHIALN